MIDLLKSLSTIEGAVMANSNQILERVVSDELEWCLELIMNKLKS